MAKSKLSRQELLEQYGVQKRKKKEKPLTYADIQNYLRERHKNVNGFCGQCKQIIDGVEQQQKFPCLSLQGVSLR